MNANCLIKNGSINALLVTFFNLIKENENHFIFQSAYRASHDCKPSIMEMEKNNELLVRWTGLPFENKSTEKVGKHILYVEKTAAIKSKEVLFNKIYQEIQIKKTQTEPFEFQQMLLLSLFTLRGSVDIKGNFFSVDILSGNKSKDHLFQIFNLLTSIDDIRQLNLNFRELQNQYVKKESKRNTQIRINLRWFYDNYLNDLLKLNEYKYRVIVENDQYIQMKNIKSKISDGFIDRMLFYIHNVYDSVEHDKNSHVLKEQVQVYRRELNFNNELLEQKGEPKRNNGIRDIAVALLPDECACCKDQYNIEDRTFKYRHNDRYYLEIHHVIAFSSNRRGDQFSNLVKVCPACHRALTKNRAHENYQKELIKNILLNSKAANKYVEILMINSSTLQEKINYVYKNLK